MAAADWSELPWDLLHEIVSRFGIPHDFARFKSVCTSWGSFASAFEQVRQSSSTPPQLFGLILPGDEKDRRCFYNPLEEKIYKNLLHIPDDHFYRGHRDGWFITLSFSTKSICLLNPVSGDIMQTVRFPSVSSLLSDKDLANPNFRFSRFRASLSANPCSQTITGGGLTMVVAFGTHKKLAYAREGGEAWVVLHDEENYARYFLDIVYYKDGFYAVNVEGRIFYLDIDCNTVPTLRVVMPFPFGKCGNCGRKMYLVESYKGGLLLVSRSSGFFFTSTFEVYQLDLKNQIKFEIRDLGDQSLFLGRHTSQSIHSPEMIGLSKNCIYFADYSDFTRVFDLGTQNHKTFLECGSLKGSSESVWFTL